MSAPVRRGAGRRGKNAGVRPRPRPRSSPRAAARGRVIRTPVGRLFLAASGGGVLLCEFSEGVTARDRARRLAEMEARAAPEQPAAGNPDRVLDRAERQLRAYFDHRLVSFDLPLDLRGNSFELKVWKALTRIPFGRTTSYGRIAARLGSPGAARAVGLANGRNPVSIIVPCHRVIGANGHLVGYGGGLDRKRALLEHEGALAPLFGMKGP